MSAEQKADEPDGVERVYNPNLQRYKYWYKQRTPSGRWGYRYRPERAFQRQRRLKHRFTRKYNNMKNFTSSTFSRWFRNLNSTQRNKLRLLLTGKCKNISKSKLRRVINYGKSKTRRKMRKANALVIDNQQDRQPVWGSSDRPSRARKSTRSRRKNLARKSTSSRRSSVVRQRAPVVSSNDSPQTSTNGGTIATRVRRRRRGSTTTTS